MGADSSHDYLPPPPLPPRGHGFHAQKHDRQRHNGLRKQACHKRWYREDPRPHPIIIGGKGQDTFGGLKVSDANSGCSHTQGDWLPEFHSLFLGLDKLHNLTMGTPTRYEIRVDLQTANESAYAVYDSFQVASSKERYRLTVGKYRGTAGKTKCVLPAGVSCLVHLEDGSATCRGPGGWNIVSRR